MCGSQPSSKQQNKMSSILFLLCLLPLLSHGQTPPVICLGTTCFTGSWIKTDKGVKYASFQGIKYAQAPVGKLRFKPPEVSKNVFCKKISCKNGLFSTLSKAISCISYKLFQTKSKLQAYTYNEALVDVSSESKVQCSQINYFSKAIVGIEDCLLLNIYVPDIAIPDSTSSNMRLPVMVWIHGGALILGSGKHEINAIYLFNSHQNR